MSAATIGGRRGLDYRQEHSDMPPPKKPNKKPGRKPRSEDVEVLVLRVPVSVAHVFNEYVESVSPKTTKQAVGVLAIVQYLQRIGRLPPNAIVEGDS
jgi:hypothetical protein